MNKIIPALGCQACVLFYTVSSSNTSITVRQRSLSNWLDLNKLNSKILWITDRIRLIRITCSTLHWTRTAINCSNMQMLIVERFQLQMKL